MKRTLPLLALALLSSPRTSPASDPQPASGPDALGILWGMGRLAPAESRLLARGGAVAKTIDTDDRSEILTFAAVRVSATVARALDRFRDVEARRNEPWTRQIGRLADPPAAPDFAGLTLDASDAQFLASCRLHRCELRLPKEAIEKLPRDLAATPAATRQDRANALFRELLARYTESYRARGNEALFYYENNDDPVGMPASLATLLARSRFLNELAPDLYVYLARYPQGRPSDVEDLTYWVKERFWLRDVLSLNHLTLADRRIGSGRIVLVVSKQLYATRYYESSLGVTACVESPAGVYLVLINRTRADIRPSGFTRVERMLLNYLVRHRLEARVASLQAQLQLPAAADRRADDRAVYQSIPMSPRVTSPTLLLKLP
jgi:hypothetical protein